MNKLKFVIPFLILVALFLMGAGCGGGGDGLSTGTPTTDVSGEDISDVPRYPGSVRVYYGPIPDTDIVVVEYLTSASIETVSDFYESELPTNGWQSPIDEETMQMLGLTYGYVGQAVEKGEEQAVVLVRGSSDYAGYTNINITFGPK